MVIIGTDPNVDDRLEERRSIELEMLRGRTIAAIIASTLVLILPWPAAAVLRPLPIVAWFGAGLFAYVYVKRARDLTRIRFITYLLVSFDIGS